MKNLLYLSVDILSISLKVYVQVPFLARRERVGSPRSGLNDGQLSFATLSESKNST
jgi:hypothetical protein